jgi:hypothetical protein
VTNLKRLQERFGASPDADISQLLGAMGIEGCQVQSRVREHLQTIGLTRSGKMRIATQKLPAIVYALHSRFAVVCGDESCDALAPKGAERLLSQPSSCSICGGSEIRRSSLRLESAVEGLGIDELRLMIVGGSPSVGSEVDGLNLARVRFRMIFGAREQDRGKVRRDVRWAHGLLVWGSTELAHKLSVPYVNEARSRRVPVVTCSRRGLPALLHTATQFLGRSWMAA